MTTSRKVALVAVGVDKTEVLPTLRGAASGAARVAAWLREQEKFGVASTIHLLTDADGARVDIRKVQDATQAVIASGGFDLLILYFAGHGIVKSGGDEQLLLSDVGRYNYEAIDIAATWSNARTSAVPHVMIVSDACRNAVDPFSRLGQVSGSPALARGRVVGTVKSKVDLFYATEPSQTAKEYKGDGFFTGIFLEALQQCPPGVCEEWQDLQTPPVIPAWRLEEYLYQEVPLRAVTGDQPFEQTPDILITSRKPYFIGFGLPQTMSVEGTKRAPRSGKHSGQRHAIRRLVEGMAGWDAEELKRRVLENSALSAHAASYIGHMQEPCDTDETAACLVRGGTVVRALLAGKAGVESLRMENDAAGQCVHLPPSAGQTVAGALLLFFSEETATILPVLPGHGSTVSVKGGRVEAFALDIKASLASSLALDDKDRNFLLWRRAAVSALASAGKLAQFGKAAEDFDAIFLLKEKYIDATMGLYGAYAYALAGDDRRIQHILRWFVYFCTAFPGGPVRTAIPFDVAMLAGEPASADAHPDRVLAPFCPAMSIGWSLLTSYVAEEELPPVLAEAARRRLNAEWTTFRQADIAPLLRALEQGELQ